MSSKLGDLPKLGLSKRSGHVGGSDGREDSLDIDLDSLLGGSTGNSSDERNQRHGSSAKNKGTDDFYSQMAIEVADDFDDSDDDEMSEKDTKSLAASLDVEDMDANLFGSFQQRKKKSSGLQNSASKIMPKNSSKSSRQSDIEIGKENSPTAVSGQGMISDKPLKSSLKKSPPMEAKFQSKPDTKKRDEELDDLLDFLSTEDKSSGIKDTKSRPREEGASQDLQRDGKLIAYTSGNSGVVRDTDKSGSKPLERITQPVSRSKPNASLVNFDDEDDDDILSGMGLDSNSKKNRSNTSGVKDNTQPVVAPGASEEKAMSMGRSLPKKDGGSKSGTEGEGFQFGGYTPSIVDSSPRSRSALSRRRGSETNTITPRPSSVPTPSKKSVRFSDEPLQPSPKKGEEKSNKPLVGEDGQAKEKEESLDTGFQSKFGRGGGRGSATPTIEMGPREDISDQVSQHGMSSSPPRSGRLSTHKTTAASIFDESNEETKPQKDLSGREEPKLEHPVFPWEKTEPTLTKKTSSQRLEDTQSQEISTVPQKKLKQETRGPRADHNEHAQYQELLDKAEKRIEEGLKRERRLEEEVKELKEKLTEIENSQRRTETDLTTKLDEYKIKLHKVELERAQLQQLSETSKQHQGEEITSLQKSHDLRVATLEESINRREARWKEELESEGLRWQEKLQQLEREKTDAVLSLKRKIDTLKVSKTNEISRLQDIHRVSVEDLKREHEADRQHLIRMHCDEVEALKAAHSHTRMLGELNSKVEASTREVSQLQAKLEQAHTRILEEKAQRNKIQEEHLKVLEERLARQQAENEGERGRLQSLIAKLEAHVSQQNKTMEQERWQLQQETARLKAQQSAFTDEKASTLVKFEEERSQLQSAKEKFLVDQQEILAKCYEEQRMAAAERAKTVLLKKKAEDREIAEKQKALMAEVERDTSLTHLNQEATRITAEQSALTKVQEELKNERKLLAEDREKLEAFAQEIYKRSKEVDELCKSALDMRNKGANELLAAQKVKEEVSCWSQSLQLQFHELREKEQHLAAEQILLAEQKREQSLVLSTRDVNIKSLGPPLSLEGRKHDGLGTSPFLSSLSDFQPPLSSSTRQNSRPPTFLQTSAPPKEGAGHTHHLPPREGMAHTRLYSPRTSPAHLTGEGQLSTSLPNYLAQIEQSINLRQIAVEAEKDKEDLEKEVEYLATLENRSGNFSGNFFS